MNPSVFLPIPVHNATRTLFVLYFDAWPTEGYFLAADYISTRGKDRLSSGRFTERSPGVQPGKIFSTASKLLPGTHDKMLTLALVQHQDGPSLFGFVQYLNGIVFLSITIQI